MSILNSVSLGTQHSEHHAGPVMSSYVPLTFWLHYGLFTGSTFWIRYRRLLWRWLGSCYLADQDRLVPPRQRESISFEPTTTLFRVDWQTIDLKPYVLQTRNAIFFISLFQTCLITLQKVIAQEKIWRVSLINIHSVGAPLVPQISTSSVKDYVYRKGSCFVGSLWDFLRWQRLFCKCNMMAFRITMSPGEIHNPWQNPIFDMEDDPVGENHHADWRNVWGRQRGECNRICTKMERASETLSRRSMIDT